MYIIKVCEKENSVEKYWVSIYALKCTCYSYKLFNTI